MQHLQTNRTSREMLPFGTFVEQKSTAPACYTTGVGWPPDNKYLVDPEIHKKGARAYVDMGSHCATLQKADGGDLEVDYEPLCEPSKSVDTNRTPSKRRARERQRLRSTRPLLNCLFTLSPRKRKPFLSWCVNVHRTASCCSCRRGQQPQTFPGTNASVKLK